VEAAAAAGAAGELEAGVVDVSLLEEAVASEDELLALLELTDEVVLSPEDFGLALP
jgi:hypothetical protein